VEPEFIFSRKVERVEALVMKFGDEADYAAWMTVKKVFATIETYKYLDSIEREYYAGFNKEGI